MSSEQETRAAKRQRMRKELVEKFEARRLALGISQRKLSQEADVGEDYYARWVSEKFQFPGSYQLIALEEALDRLEQVHRFHKKLKTEGAT